VGDACEGEEDVYRGVKKTLSAAGGSVAKQIFTSRSTSMTQATTATGELNSEAMPEP
jgi:hypothetical protein